MVVDVADDDLVTPLPSTVKLTASPASSLVQGMLVTFTATVTGNGTDLPTGSVTFTDSIKGPLGTVDLAPGASTDGLADVVHSLFVHYDHDEDGPAPAEGVTETSG